MQRRGTANFIRAQANVAQAWMEQYPAESAWLSAQAPTFGFAASLLSSLHKWGKLTDNQLAAVQRLLSAPSREDRAAAAPTRAVAFARQWRPHACKQRALVRAKVVEAEDA
jgi:hypothetical protein